MADLGAGVWGGSSTDGADHSLLVVPMDMDREVNELTELVTAWLIVEGDEVTAAANKSASAARFLSLRTRL